MKPKEYDDDNGMVIADMNVEGTPWYNENNKQKSSKPSSQQLTRSEVRRYNFYSILAGMLIVLVFSTTWVLFTLFMTQIWFK